ncbi:MAG: shikimate dehydrogenase [Coxiellaceae bacterium]|nr:shikimate dehydrogenase [Coxiellaceae bacterium]
MLRFCIFGNPIKHSISPQIHREFARQAGLEISYVKVAPKPDQFENAVRSFQQQGGHGANITSPFKEHAFTLCDSITERAGIAKSVNTFLFQDGKIIGDNTDGIGLIRDITINLQYGLGGKKIMILGAGGAVRGILQPLLNEKPREIIIMNRSLDNAKKMADEFSVDWLDTLENQTADVVIDCLPFNTTIALPDSFLFSNNSLFYDLKYNQIMLKNNATIKANGLGMVVEQAAEAFFGWTGFRPCKHSLRSCSHQDW